jgi:hypothetical protein
LYDRDAALVVIRELMFAGVASCLWMCYVVTCGCLGRHEVKSQNVDLRGEGKVGWLAMDVELAVTLEPH